MRGSSNGFCPASPTIILEEGAHGLYPVPRTPPANPQIPGFFVKQPKAPAPLSLCREGRKPIDAALVFRGPIRFHFVRPLIGGPAIQRLTRFLEIVKRNRKPAGIAHARYRDMNIRPGSSVGRKKRREFRKARMLGRDDGSFAMKPNNFRRTFKGTKHDDESTIFTEVSHRLRPAAGVVLVNPLM